MRFASLILVLPVFISIALVLLPATLSECLPSHRDSLLRLRQEFRPVIGSRDIEPFLTWDPNTDCCKWPHVICNNTSGEVVKLLLGNLSISGFVEPAALFSLTSLTHLDLSFNSLNFSLISSSSSGFESLGKLKYLNLSTSGLQGQIPGSIGKLTNLVYLDLSNIYAFPSVKLENPNLEALIRNLGNLEVLYLDYVNISDAAWYIMLPRWAPKLRKLSASSCSLSGPLHDSLSELKFLTELRLDRNNFSSEVPESLGRLSSLQILRLSSCGLRGQLPETIYLLSNLKLFDVSNNPALSGNLLESLGNLTSLEMLMLSGCNFSGQLPSSMNKLTELTVVDLSSNGFNGTVPSFESSASSISDVILSNNNLEGRIMDSTEFTNLRRLDLRNNSLKGQVPASLFRLPQLQILLLSLNKLSGGVSTFGVSSSLQNLDLGSNMLQGSIPQAFFTISGLRILVCSNNNFSGTVSLTLLSNLPNLTNLDLSNNMLTVMAPNSSSSFPMLQTLKLAYCNLTIFPKFLGDQKSLSYLDLSGNRITGNIPKWIWKVRNYLNLSNNLLTGFEGNQPDLQNSTLTVIDLHQNELSGAMLLLPPSNIFVDLSDNHFSFSLPLVNFERLQFNVFFSVSNNNLTGSIPPSICNSTNMLVLDLSYNGLDGTLPSCLAEMGTLSVLNLKRNKLSGFLPTNFSKNCTLRTLNVNWNRLEGVIPESLSNCTQLEVIDVGNNLLGGSFPSWLANLPELRVLVLRTNRFEGSLQNFSNSNGDAFKMLQIIDISTNKFNGSLPSESFRNLKAMMLSDEKASHAVQFNYLNLTKLYYRDTVMITSKGQVVTLMKIMTIFSLLDVSSNNFDGSIPEIIGDLSSLILLNMSHNNLTGTIPSSFGSLRQLESLDLSFNRLSGEIPQQLAYLNFLSFLNLSYNNLSGTIPSGPQFRTFTELSYLGQDSLCGAPLKKCTRENSSDPPSSGEPSWLYIFVGFGFGGGMAIVCMPLIIWEEGRKPFNKHVDIMLLTFVPSCFWNWAIWEWIVCRNGKVDDDNEIEEKFSESEVEMRRSFCVFCTRLEFCLKGQVRIQHVECSCSKEL